MTRELNPRIVAERLATLRGLYVPESIDEGRVRIARDVGSPQESFEVRVARRLTELRALCDLANYLHRH